jgi:hypothetical protein
LLHDLRRSPGSQTDFVQFIGDETDKWSKVVKFSGAKPD